MGIALGCIRLSFDDFCGLTPDEFQEVYDAYHDKEEMRYHGDWERIRMLAAIVIQPYSKKKISPQKLLPFPWEKEHEKKLSGHPQLTKEEDLRRFENLIKGMKG